MLNPYSGGEFRVTQRFTLGQHNALDIVGTSSKTLIALNDAEVIQSRIVTDKNDLTWQWGNYVMLRTANGTRIVYAHLSRRLVSAGERVRTGQAVGIEGNTGYSFGAHCHLEVRNSDNRVTAAVNTPAYTGIPNALGAYNAYTEPGMSNDARAALEAMEPRIAWLEEQNRIYRWYTQLPDYAREPIERLHREGVFVGAGPGDMDLPRDVMRMLVILDKNKII